MKNASEKKTILDALELGALPLEDQEEILLTLNDLVFRGALVRLIERMDDGDRDAFSEMISRDAPEEELNTFLRKVEGSEEVVKEAVDELTDDILAVTNP